MLYLALQFSWFLLMAFAIGLVFGWLTLGGGRGEAATGPVAGLAILWLALAALAWFRLVNDQAAFWIETALLHLLAYAAGCLVGSLFGARGAVAVPALAPPAPLLALPQPAPALPSPPARAAQGGSEPIGAEASVGKCPANLLPAARGGKPDNLELIAGIDAVVAGKLNALGLWHFDQIVALAPEELHFIARHAGVPDGDVARGWQAEAKILAAGGQTEHARTAKGRRGRKKR
ncbi:hypothetical protein [Bosea sp. CS1GBMeth4]|uniref:hypothetical protein n=1 Tax=Bosea sp. CS1GBMeth4 TaxID=1892849 RepID=UPI00164934C1|nr:hypothetical protein [Bosea sp. CS1GBMeth4]